MRIEYIKKLIDGTRKSINRMMMENHLDTRLLYPECIAAEYLDATLLCDVIEEDLGALNMERENVLFVLKLLKARADGKSEYCDAIMDFFLIDNRFIISACVFKDNEDKLVDYIIKTLTEGEYEND